MSLGTRTSALSASFTLVCVPLQLIALDQPSDAPSRHCNLGGDDVQVLEQRDLCSQGLGGGGEGVGDLAQT